MFLKNSRAFQDSQTVCSSASCLAPHSLHWYRHEPAPARMAVTLSSPAFWPPGTLCNPATTGLSDSYSFLKLWSFIHSFNIQRELCACSVLWYVILGTNKKAGAQKSSLVLHGLLNEVLFPAKQSRLSMIWLKHNFSILLVISHPYVLAAPLKLLRLHTSPGFSTFGPLLIWWPRTPLPILPWTCQNSTQGSSNPTSWIP